MPRTSRRSAPGRPRTAALNREKVLRAAIRLADEKGLDALSMRTLAARLGVEAMSLYNHVANKDDILGGITDLVVAEIDVPEPRADWKPAMRKRAISAHDVLLCHPWAAGLFESRRTPSPVQLRYANAILGILLAGGFPIAVAYRAFLTVDSYIYGFMLQEVNWPRPTEPTREIAERLRPAIPASEYPHVAAVMELITHDTSPPSSVRQADFVFGLDLILDALQRERERAGVPAPIEHG
jgi:AcrR family transcriptional regulator